MKKNPWKLLVMAGLSAVVFGCGGGGGDPVTDLSPEDSTNSTWNLSDGLPVLVSQSFIPFENFTDISKFRSSVDGNYPSDFETCRTMKHSFKINPPLASDVEIYAPVSGSLVGLEQGTTGYRLSIQDRDYPAFVLTIDHVTDLVIDPEIGTAVTAGEPLGFHHPEEDYSDIAVAVNTPEGIELLSYFQVMDPQLLSEFAFVYFYYLNDGNPTPQDFLDRVLISKEERDGSPLTCVEGEYDSAVGDPIEEQWIQLLGIGG